MGIIDETVREMQEQKEASGGDGTAFHEWLKSRELNEGEFFDVTQREAVGLEGAVLQGVELTVHGIMQAAFRWGYECAVKKRAREDEKELGL